MKKIAWMWILLISSPATAAGSSVPYGMGREFSRFDPVVARYYQ